VGLGLRGGSWCETRQKPRLMVVVIAVRSGFFVFIFF
jgi:hypothetical protein